ncbi:hypothetical protein BRADI_3g53175v3 [Brachypodium distachyon]|uniref:Uncharacterized protein n=1 Tax=Brachypodium distachyon TaxID=15368 RepID=A0A2K2D4U5_BRADI|nr:hypothetical protein BRADI_3g53175v3 [Brachypodium distachyon]
MRTTTRRRCTQPEGRWRRLAPSRYHTVPCPAGASTQTVKLAAALAFRGMCVYVTTSSASRYDGSPAAPGYGGMAPCFSSRPRGSARSRWLPSFFRLCVPLKHDTAILGDDGSPGPPCPMVPSFVQLG